MDASLTRMALLRAPVLVFAFRLCGVVSRPANATRGAATTTFTGNVTRPDSKDLTIGRVQFEAPPAPTA